MKQKIVDKVILVYAFWSVAMLAIFILISDYRSMVFGLWWISTVIVVMYLLINILYVTNIKKKILKDKQRELLNERLSRRTNRRRKDGGLK